MREDSSSLWPTLHLALLWNWSRSISHLGSDHTSKPGSHWWLGLLWLILINIYISPVKKIHEVNYAHECECSDDLKIRALSPWFWLRSMTLSANVQMEANGNDFFQLTHWQMIRLAVIETRALAGTVMPPLICSDWESSAQDCDDEHKTWRRVKALYH